MRINFEDDNRNHFEILEANGIYTLRATNGIAWRDWPAKSNEIPNIHNFVQQFRALADTMIKETGSGNQA